MDIKEFIEAILSGHQFWEDGLKISYGKKDYQMSELCIILSTKSLPILNYSQKEWKIIRENTAALIEANILKPEENKAFRAGVIDAFCEVVAAGVKKLAFSHATNDDKLFGHDLEAAYYCAKKYKISMYVEEHLVETLLFKNSGSKVIIFYRDAKDIADYLALKENPQLTDEEKINAARELGRLLSYQPERIESMIAKRLIEIGE